MPLVVNCWWIPRACSDELWIGWSFQNCCYYPSKRVMRKSLSSTSKIFLVAYLYYVPLHLSPKNQNAAASIGFIYAEQHVPFFFKSDESVSCLTTMVVPSPGPAVADSSDARAFLLTIRYISVKILWNAFSTFVASKADVSMKERPSFSEKACASSVETPRRCLRSDLLPTNMITMLESAWSLSSFSHLSTFS